MSREVMTIRPMVIDRGGGACEESQAPFFVSPFRKGAKGYLFISLMQEKRNQRVHYPQGPLQRGMQKIFRRDRRKILGFGKPGRRLIFF